MYHLIHITVILYDLCIKRVDSIDRFQGQLWPSKILIRFCVFSLFILQFQMPVRWFHDGKNCMYFIEQRFNFRHQFGITVTFLCSTSALVLLPLVVELKHQWLLAETEFETELWFFFSDAENYIFVETSWTGLVNNVELSSLSLMTGAAGVDGPIDKRKYFLFMHTIFFISFFFFQSNCVRISFLLHVLMYYCLSKILEVRFDKK